MELDGRNSIETLVPHRSTMLFIEKVLEEEPERVRVSTTVTANRLFVDGAGWPAWVGIELMAQTVASWAGLKSRLANEPVKLGFLLGTRRYESTCEYFPLGARLEIEARQELVGANGLAVFDCSIVLEGQTVASAHLNVFQPPDVQAYLRENSHG